MAGIGDKQVDLAKTDVNTVWGSNFETTKPAINSGESTVLAKGVENKEVPLAKSDKNTVWGSFAKKVVAKEE